MALLIDKDGTETVGGIQAIRDAFVAAAAGKLACNGATMVHGEGNSQLLTFSGVWAADGKPFQIKQTVPPGAPLAPHARAMARRLLAENAGS